MSTFLQDLRFALRHLRGSPSVFVVAILSLALGVAANTTIFSAVDVFMFRPLPYPDEDRILQLWTTNPPRGWEEASSSLPDLLDYREASRTLDVAAYTSASFNLGGDRPERLEGQGVSWNLFRVMGVAPALGRPFTPEEEAVGSSRVVVLSDGVWHRRFGADPAVVGRTLLLNGEQHTVVGVMPPDFDFPSNETEVWAPLGVDGTEDRDSRFYQSVARLRPDASLEAARAELEGIAARLAGQYPESNTGMGVRLLRVRDQLYGEEFRQATMIVSVAVAFVLLIACANVANLLLARAAGREREIAVRASLGAGRFRIARQMLTESLLLAAAGGALGLLLSVWGVGWLVSLMPAWFTGVEEIGIDGRVVAYTLGISVGAALLFGLLPALQASKPNLSLSLKEGGRGSTSGPRRGRLRGALVVSEIALALVLLVSAGLLVKAFIGLRSVDLGFETEDLLTFRVTLPEPGYPDSIQAAAFYARLLPRLESLPGVEAVGATTILPMDGGSGTYYSVVGEPEPPEGEEPVVGFRGVSPGYFMTLGIPLVRGRAFSDGDRMDAPPVVVVNRTMAERHWPDGDPIGGRLEFSSGQREIVGVVGNTLDGGPGGDAEPMAYVPAAQRGYRSLSIALRTSGDPAALASAVRAEVAALDANLPVYSLRTMDELVDEQLRGDTIMGKIMGVFAAVAFLLALIGVYGAMAYSVSQRRGEMGVRMALGAQPGQIVRLVLRQGGALALTGVGIGLVLAAGVSRTLSVFLYGVSALDPGIFAGVTLTLAGTALAACYLPGRRASRVDPIEVLRTE